MQGSKLSITGEDLRMKAMFASLSLGLVSAAVLIYFLMVVLFALLFDASGGHVGRADRRHGRRLDPVYHGNPRSMCSRFSA